jgi:cobalamin transport system substrate-binding protein
MVPRFPRITLLLVVLLAACAPAPSTSPGSTVGPSPSSSAAPSEPPAYPVTLTDDAGRSVTFDAEPERIVLRATSNTEIVCALDACDRLVGVTDFDDYPAEVAEVRDVVIGAQVDTEAVVAADPDLVLAAGNELTPSTVIAQLRDLGLTVMTIYPETLDDVYEDIGLVGAALGRDADAADLVGGMRERAATVEAAVAGHGRPRTFYEVGVFENTIFTAGDGSFIASLVDLAGGEPIVGDPFGTISLEALVVADPELIVLGDASYDGTITADSVALRPGWAELTAVREGNVIEFVDDLVVTRPGPRVVAGLEALARAIHPEAFD